MRTMAYKEDVNSPLIITLGAISGFLVIVIVIGLQAWFATEEQQELTDRYTDSASYQLVGPTVAQVRAEQQKKIDSYRWIDRDKQIAAIPIDQAMRLLIQNNGTLPTTQPK
jgi:hypothetical protein